MINTIKYFFWRVSTCIILCEKLDTDWGWTWAYVRENMKDYYEYDHSPLEAVEEDLSNWYS